MGPFKVRCQGCDRRLGAGEDWHPIGDKKFLGDCCKEKGNVAQSPVHDAKAEVART